MKKMALFAAACLTGLLVFNACDKEITDDWADLDQLNPANQDLNGGTWKTVALTAPDAVALAAPTAANSPEYLQEIAETKQVMAGLTDAQREAIRYWSAGSVLRWNEILRELVAKRNLAPAPNADGTYTAPDAANPFSYPEFPFANPCYAARAYGYVSVAQYDALVAAWHYKAQYDRPSAYNADATITPLVPKNELPGYPNEDAVVAGAAFVMLRALFPADTTYINEKVAEAAYYKQWAGAAVKSDVIEGLKLGKAVANVALNRAKNDGMKNANGNPAIRDSLYQRVASTGETAWKSQDVPVRAGLLCYFGAVTPFLFPKDTVIAIRLPQPPSTGSAEFKAELAAVKEAADPGDREKMRIVHFWADGAGTYTPPGHWNLFAFENIYRAGQSEIRAARNFALLNMAMMDAAISCWDVKYHYMVPRPSQMDPEIKTLTGLPNFPAYSSGHSTFSSAGATLLGHLFPTQATSFDAMAKEASLSRLYGGIHYPMDCEGGLIQGRRIGEFAIARARTDGAE